MAGPSARRILNDLARLPVPLAAETPARLAAFVDILERRAVPLGLVARSDAGRLWDRHVLDCLRAATVLRTDDRTAYDLGSGAGLPGIVLALAAPGCQFVLVESNRRASGFLELVTERLELENVQVAVVRAESMGGRYEPGDIVTARAFGPLEAAWGAAGPLLRLGGKLVYFAGKKLGDPEEAARSVAAPDQARVAVVRGIENTGPLVIMERSQ